MTKKVERSALVKHSAAQMYELVKDIESYPQFMPGCDGAKILKQEENTVVATLVLSKSGIQQSFTTRNQMQSNEHIHIELEDGPFKVFRGRWDFIELEPGASKVVFQLEYEFSNFLLGVTAGKLIQNVAGDQVDAICKRADLVYA